MRSLILASLLVAATPAIAQDAEGPRYRVALGVQVTPQFPGADDTAIGPLVDVARARAGEAFPFEAPDEGFGLPLVSLGGVEVGPAFAYQTEREEADVGAAVGDVDGTIEAGAFVQYYLAPSFRVRVEGRRGLGGHEGWVGNVGADFVARDGDRYVFSIGPRLLLSDERYQRAYFGVSGPVSTATGLPVYRSSGAAYAAGATAGLQYQLSDRWGIMGYARYDRLIGDAADSPIVRTYGSRDQFSGGIAATFTFGR